MLNSLFKAFTTLTDVWNTVSTNKSLTVVCLACDLGYSELSIPISRWYHKHLVIRHYAQLEAAMASITGSLVTACGLYL